MFKALADPTRRAILDELVERDGQTLFEICSRLAVKHGPDLRQEALPAPASEDETAALFRVATGPTGGAPPPLPLLKPSATMRYSESNTIDLGPPPPPGYALGMSGLGAEKVNVSCPLFSDRVTVKSILSSASRIV